MKETRMTKPEIILLAGTRVALGIGVGLILADKLNESKRKGAGWALFLVGALTTIPIVLNVLGKSTSENQADRRSIEEVEHA